MTAFVDEFARTLSKADGIIVADIYAAREIDYKVIHSKDLCKKIMEFNDNVIYIPDFDEIENYILTHCVPRDMLITMGAGNIHLIGDDLLKA
jgi:UDP-N-acetylmuramate--alanine ligase